MIGSGMMKDSFAKAYNKLVQRYNKQGYLTEDDFIAITEKLDIPLIRLSELQERLYDDGIELSHSDGKKPTKLKSKFEETVSAKQPETINEIDKSKSSKYDSFYDSLDKFDSQTVRNLFFHDFSKSKSQSSYMPVFVLAFFENLNSIGAVSFDKIVNYFKNYYLSRKHKGLVVERNDSIFVKKEPSEKEIRRLILFNPMGRSCLRKYFRYDKTEDVFIINPILWRSLSLADWNLIINESNRLLKDYYNRKTANL